MSEQLLLDISNRVVQATAQHLATSTVALNAISPSPQVGIEAPVLASLVPKTLAGFERRMWIATNLFDKGGAYVYYGAANGEFVGLHRDKTGRFELRVRESDASGRTIYEATGPDARGRTLRVDNYDPRARLWYAMASNRGAIGWSPVYVDFTTQALTVSLAKPIYATGASDNTAGTLRGVVATDVPLTALNEFMSGLQVSRTGVAFIVERDGSQVATSTPEPLVTNSSQQQTRLHAEKSANPLVRQAYQQWRDNMLPSVKRVRDVDVALYNFDGDAGRVQMSSTAPSAAVGLDWTMLVAIPHADHMGDVRRTVLANVVIGLLAVALAIGTGLWIMHRVTGDVRRLSDATRLLARGQSPGRLFAGRHDELGVIANAMEDFKNGLLTDPLTGALTRATFEKRFATYIGHLPDPRQAIVFVDLDRFKRVNDDWRRGAGHLCAAYRVSDAQRRFNRALWWRRICIDVAWSRLECDAGRANEPRQCGAATAYFLIGHECACKRLMRGRALLTRWRHF